MLTGKLTGFIAHHDHRFISGITNSRGTLGAMCKQITWLVQVLRLKQNFGCVEGNVSGFVLVDI